MILYGKEVEKSTNSEFSDFLAFRSGSWLLSKSNTKLTSGASISEQSLFGYLEDCFHGAEGCYTSLTVKQIEIQIDKELNVILLSPAFVLNTL